MAYPSSADPSGSTGARRRPGVVTAAVYALYGLFALQLISIVLQLMNMGPTIDATREYAEEVGTAEADAVVTTSQIFGYVAIAILVLFTIAYLLLAVFVGKGRNAARITTWVVLGLGLCCGAGALTTSAASGLMGDGGATTGGFDQAELQRRIQAEVPSWATPVSYALTALSIILALAAIILLALPAANEFFRKAQPAWEPPVPGAVYPSGPGQPSGGQPGQPGYPGQSGDPGYPGQSGTPGNPDQPGSGYRPPG